jgi:simple sugar transport system ATP-binding protein
MTDIFLQAAGISKAFAGVQALSEVDLTIGRGEVLCLVGENGSGKSTFIKIICGVYTPDSGTLTISGRAYRRLRPRDAVREGIQVIFQDFSLFPNLSVAENIAFNGLLAERRRLVDWRAVRQTARDALDRIGVNVPLDGLVSELPVADKQLVAIARAIVQDARLIIMDEPTTALTQREVEALLDVVRGLQGKGVSTLFVSHKLEEVKAVAQRVVIFRNGAKVHEGDAAPLTPAQIAFHMTGHEVHPVPYRFDPAPDTPPLLEVSHLTRAGAFADISFALRPGEIVGITGLLGSGRTELALALFGVQPADSGTIAIDGQPASIRSIQDAMRHRIGYVPEDRLTEGLFLPRSIGDNIVARTLRDLLNPIGLIDGGARRTRIDQWIRDLRIKTQDDRLPVRSLSGGNQQRVVIARWLASLPRVLILNGPTVGVDIGSKDEIHAIIRELAAGGIGVLIISDDIPEVMSVCSRVLVMKRGRLSASLNTRAITDTQLSAMLLSDAAAAETSV